MSKEGYPPTLGPCPECEETVYVTDVTMANCNSCPFECLISEYDDLYRPRNAAREQGGEWEGCTRIDPKWTQDCGEDGTRICLLHNLHCGYPDCAKGRRERIERWEQQSREAGEELLDAVRKPNAPRPKFRDDGWPTRADMLLLSPAELAIRAAIEAVEITGASVALTDAVILLGKARDLVADHVEGHGNALIAPQNRLA